MTPELLVSPPRGRKKTLREISKEGSRGSREGTSSQNHGACSLDVMLAAGVRAVGYNEHCDNPTTRWKCRRPRWGLRDLCLSLGRGRGPRELGRPAPDPRGGTGCPPPARSGHCGRRLPRAWKVSRLSILCRIHVLNSPVTIARPSPCPAPHTVPRSYEAIG